MKSNYAVIMMKRLRKSIGMIIGIAVLAVCAVPAFAELENQELTPGEMEVIEGIVMPVDEFRDAYTGDPMTRVPAQSIQNAALILENIVVREDNVRFTGIIETAERKTEIPVSGKLASGYKTEAGINSLIVEVEDSGEEFKFLLFEVYDDNGDDNLLTGENSVKYQNQPHAKIYLRDSDAMIYLFEGQIPAALSGYQAQSFQSADAMKDMHWAASVGKTEYQELEVTPELLDKLGMKSLPESENDVITWTLPSIFYHSINAAGEFQEDCLFKCLSYSLMQALEKIVITLLK